MPRVRLSLDIDATTKERLDVMKARLEASSVTAVIKRSLLLLDAITEDKNNRIQLVKPDGSTETVRLL